MQNVRVEINKVLQYFSKQEQDYIQDIVQYSEDSISKKTYYFLFKCIRSIDGNTTQAKKDLFIEMLEQIFIKDTEDNVDIIHSGENYYIEIRLRKDEDFSGANLIARLDADSSPLSSQSLKGTDASIQRVDLIDLDLSSETFHKVNVLLETQKANGLASGDSISLINVVYLFILEDIDQ